MVNQNSIFGGMLTNQGAAKKTNCDALGIPWEPRYMLIGDANGADPVPNPAQTKLINQVYRAQLNQLRVSPTDDNILIAELVLPPDVGGWWIRELGLEDKDGVFCAVANAAPSYKPLLAQGSGRNQVVRMHIITSGTSNIQLKIDPSVVLATRQYVDETINGLLPANKAAGTYTKVTVNDRGVFVSGSNPTTLAGYGITDALTSTQVNNALSNKADKATTLAGYGITDAFNKTETTAAIKAALSVPVVQVAATKALVANDLGLVDSTAGATNITLPESNAALGVRDVVIRRVDNGGNRLTVMAAGADKIKFHTHLSASGYPFFVLMGGGDWWRLRSDGVGGWWPVGRYDNTPLGRPNLETTTAISPGGWGLYHGLIYNRAEWPWLWDHAQASGMLTTEALRAGNEGKWTSGDGALTFRTPEGRGEFMRFLDEGRGVDAGRVAGSWQKGTQVGADTTGSADGFFMLGLGAVAATPIASFGIDAANMADYPPQATAISGATTSVPSATIFGSTRPRNSAYPGRIKMI
jgi:phage-related tail fiber protein